jgi:outer membrane immunogenic protein
VKKNDTFGAASLESKMKRTEFGTVRGRLGYAAKDTRWYVTGGWAWYEQSLNATLAGVSAHDQDFHTGWVIGAGVEKAFAPNWTWKLEYLYADFDRGFYTLAPALGANLVVSDFKVSTVRFGVNYKFGDWFNKAPVSARY